MLGGDREGMAIPSDGSGIPTAPSFSKKPASMPIVGRPGMLGGASDGTAMPRDACGSENATPSFGGLIPGRPGILGGERDGGEMPSSGTAKLHIRSL
jgi:hypothetical protein